ncbi:MAG: DUF3718 domain-containing protein [Aliiglaciecola sp.]|uniref:DUF3718 domain-containing protein n=1 Tax=Aliiglaciecola sp. TaxID=1872441 RepID=UPI00329985B8
MIRKLFIILTFVMINVFYASNAKGDINTALNSLCAIVASDDYSNLQQKLTEMRTQYRLKLQHYYDGISCGGQSLIRTALLNEAHHTAQLLMKNLPKSKLTAPERDGKTLRQWINEKNLMGTPSSDVLSNQL